MPVAVAVISNVVPPRPATLPVHCSCVPMSVHVGVPTKCPDCACAAEALSTSTVNVASATKSERFIRFSFSVRFTRRQLATKGTSSRLSPFPAAGLASFVPRPPHWHTSIRTAKRGSLICPLCHP